MDDGFTKLIAPGLNNLIALIDADPAMHFRGNEAKVIILKRDDSSVLPVAAVHNNCGDSDNLVLVNLSSDELEVPLPRAEAGLLPGEPLFDNIKQKPVKTAGQTEDSVIMAPFSRMWLTEKKITIPADLIVD